MASSVTCLLKYSVTTPDERTPWVPDNAYLEKILRKEAEYPSPYPESELPAKILGPSNNIKSNEGAFNCGGSIVHSIEKTVCIAATYINIDGGSIIVGDVVALKAPVVRIVDDKDSPIRTSLIARKALIIETDILIVDGADIFLPEDYSIQAKQALSFYNVSPNTQIFLNALRAPDANANTAAPAPAPGPAAAASANAAAMPLRHEPGASADSKSNGNGSVAKK